MWVKFKNWKIEDLDFTINLTNNCNLSCSYCPLYNHNEVISYEILDKYISFFLDNKEEIYEKCINVVIIFFWWECLLESDKITYFIEKTKHLKMKYVIYTNWLLVTKEIINKLNKYDINKRIVFAMSIDWDKDISLKYRFKNDKVFSKLIQSIELVKNNNFAFSVSKVILEDDKNNFFENMKFLHLLWPNKLFFIPVTYFYKEWFSNDSIKWIIKWFKELFNYFENMWYSRLNIMEYLWLPDTFDNIKSMYKVDYGLFWDIDGTIYWILDALPWYKTSKLFDKKELKEIKIWKIDRTKKLLKLIDNYRNHEEKMIEIWKIWNKKHFPNDEKIMRVLNMFFIKELLMYKYKPQY